MRLFITRAEAVGDKNVEICPEVLPESSWRESMLGLIPFPCVGPKMDARHRQWV